MDDSSLLKHYTRTRDADAFTELVRDYSGMVYATCVRITANAHDAEDVSQECFMELAAKSASIASSLSGWLHSVATNRSKMAVRGATRRKRHEREAAAETHVDSAPTWEELAPHVDEALETLPEELRLPLICHYLQGKSQSQVAEKLGLDQSTVSRRLETGLVELQGKLKSAGVVASVAILGSLLVANAAPGAVPASLTAVLGRIAMSGAGNGATAFVTGTAPATTILGATTGKIAIAAVAGAILVGAGLVYYATLTHEDTPPTLPSPQAGGKALQPDATNAITTQAVITILASLDNAVREGNIDGALSYMSTDFILTQKVEGQSKVTQSTREEWYAVAVAAAEYDSYSVVRERKWIEVVILPGEKEGTAVSVLVESGNVFGNNIPNRGLKETVSLALVSGRPLITAIDRTVLNTLPDHLPSADPAEE